VTMEVSMHRIVARVPSVPRPIRPSMVLASRKPSCARMSSVAGFADDRQSHNRPSISFSIPHSAAPHQFMLPITCPPLNRTVQARRASPTPEARQGI